MKHYLILSNDDNMLVSHGYQDGHYEDIQALNPRRFLIDPADLPADFSVATYTISDGQLVRASDEVIAEREAAATLAYNEQQRLLREAEYRATTDPLVIDAIAESTPEIKALKDAIRAKYPYRS